MPLMNTFVRCLSASSSTKTLHHLAPNRTPFVANSLSVGNNISRRGCRSCIQSRSKPYEVSPSWRMQDVSGSWSSPHTHLFGIESLRLDRLTTVRHRSSFGHYLFDFTSPLVFLLRSLEGVRGLAFVCNQAMAERHFRTCYNRVVG